MCCLKITMFTSSARVHLFGAGVVEYAEQTRKQMEEKVLPVIHRYHIAPVGVRGGLLRCRNSAAKGQRRKDICSIRVH